MIRLENISKYYHSNTSVTCALRKVNLSFKKGEFVAITGESGSGKTTLLNVISGLDTYEEGEMYFKNQPTSSFDNDDWDEYRKREIAFIFQNYNLIDSYSLLENVMLSPLINEYSFEEAKMKALKYLEIVGLKKFAKKRASKLSSGQKQRLSIARALAKETDIIVADEPTGNLDQENGIMIMELLKEISKNKLVLVVTHNYKQAEQYVTRTIRLHDAIVVDDILMNEQNILKEENEIVPIKKRKCNSFIFALLNMKSQPRRCIILLLLFLLVAIVNFISIGTITVNIDGDRTKNISTSFFRNFDQRRILVKNTDGSIIDISKVKDIDFKHIDSIEKYDYITDTNYFRPDSYRYIISGGFIDDPTKPQIVDRSSIFPEDFNHFMRSTSSLTESDLKYGTLPTNNLQMVVYSDDESILNTKELVLFSNQQLWGKDTYLSFDVTIVGILKKPTDQAYFSSDLCETMDIIKNNFQIKTKITLPSQIIDPLTGNLIDAGFEFQRDFKTIYLDPSLEGYTAIVHSDILNSYPQSLYYNYETSPLTMDFIKTKKNGTQTINETKYSIDCYLTVKKTSKQDKEFIGLSKDLFNQIILDVNNERTQFVAYSKDPAYTTRAVNELFKYDMLGISCFKSSLTSYNVDKVIKQYITLGICFFGLVIINVMIILIGKSLLKARRNDFTIFKFMGMTSKTTKEVDYIELIIYALFTSLVVLVASIFVSKYVKLEFISSMFKYLRTYHYILFVFVNLLTNIILGRSFNKYLLSRNKITSLKEE